MRIGIVTEYYYPTLGGIQEHVHHLALHARRAGHDVRILTPEVKDGLASVGRAVGSAAAARRADEDNGVIRLGTSIPLLSGGSIARMSAGPSL
jgi:phosphatidylinositol alpha-mannosyltransferase